MNSSISISTNNATVSTDRRDVMIDMDIRMEERRVPTLESSK
jgi:hypothetical protein